MQAANVLRQVSGVLQDLEPGMEKRWPWTGGQSDSIGLLDFLNAALRDVAMQRPDCFAVTEIIQLEQGMKQQIPKVSVHGSTYDAIGFCGLIRNEGNKNGTKPGRAILLSPQSAIMAWQDPDNSRLLKRSGKVDNYAYDRAVNPNVYWVYPSVPDVRLYVEATYYAMPPEITSSTQNIGVSDGYSQAIVHHMLASIFGGDSEDSNSTRSKYHWDWYQQLMNIKLQVDAKMPKAFTSSGG